MIVWAGFAARHLLSVIPPALLLWNIACVNEATHERVIDRWMVMFLQWHHLDRMVKLRQLEANRDAQQQGVEPPKLRLCFERYECLDWPVFVRKCVHVCV